MITAATAARVHQVLDQIAGDALAIFEEQLRERSPSETEFTAAMAAKRERLARWVAQAAADICADLDTRREPSLADRVRELELQAMDLRAACGSFQLRLTTLEHTVYAGESPDPN